MDLKHSFTVPASVQETWDTFLDIQDVAGCFPGATVTEVEGDDFKGTAKIKLGPISLVYAGSGTFLERDEAGHRFVVEAKGRDKRGNGTASATVTAQMTAEGEEHTRVDVDTLLSITGKPAQFGRGVIQDVSDKLLQQFMDCLESKVGAPPTPEPEVAPQEAPAAPLAPGDESGGGAGAEVPTTTAPPRPAPAAPRQEAEALDLGATVVPILLKTYWRQLAAAVLVVLVLRRLLRGRRRA